MLNSKRIFLLVFIVFSPVLPYAQTKAPSHELFDKLLKKNVSGEGRVNYKSFLKDSSTLNQYLTLLQQSPPHTASWSRYEQMAYWINAYNAFTIQLILRHYPVKSIKDIGGSIQIPFINTPWDIKFIHLGKEILDLNNIEHDQLRKNFNDPRVHMALVCASKSCPILLNEAYDPVRLEAQLTKQTKSFLSDSFRNKLAQDRPQISMIFRWYGMDFTKNGGSVRSFINAYSDIKIIPDAKVGYLNYNWELNE